MSDLLSAIASTPSYRWLTIAKLAVAAGASIVLAWQLFVEANNEPDRHKRVRDAALAALGVAAFGCWWNFGRFHNPGFIHVHEQYHYYVGAKYFRELGYTRLYHCAAVADIEDGLGGAVVNRWVRNLATNDLERGETILVDQKACTSHFTAERWASFKRDVAWFRERRGPDGWRDSQRDHGYNATPVWGIAGTTLANATRASDRTILALALIDPALLVLMFAAIWWAFGWRSLCVALIWWGTNYPARLQWTGGGFLRADWLMLTVLGIALAKRGKPAAAGFALTYAALLRVFPALIVTALIAKAGVHIWSTGRLTLLPAHAAFAKGCLAAVLLLVPLSLVVVGGDLRGGIDAWKGFVANSRKHLDTPLTNNVGLMSVVAYQKGSTTSNLRGFDIDTPWDTWNSARRRVMLQRRPILWLLIAAYLALLVRAVRDREDWIVLVLGIGLIPIATQLTSDDLRVAARVRSSPQPFDVRGRAAYRPGHDNSPDSNLLADRRRRVHHDQRRRRLVRAGSDDSFWPPRQTVGIRGRSAVEFATRTGNVCAIGIGSFCEPIGIPDVNSTPCAVRISDRKSPPGPRTPS